MTYRDALGNFPCYLKNDSNYDDMFSSHQPDERLGGF